MNNKRVARARLWGMGIRACGICGERIEAFSDATIDHIVPLGRWGSNQMSNLQLAHYSCNNAKGNQLRYAPPKEAAHD
mgnify:CR=1 FL=1|jgi:5-methylcytosine-specific restriction endonuclease McrA